MCVKRYFIYLCFSEKVKANLLKCWSAICMINESETKIIELELVKDLMKLERLMLDMASTERVTAGIHFHISFSEHNIVRFFESGCLAGYMTNSMLCHLKTTALPYKLFTCDDVKKRAAMLRQRSLNISLKRRKDQSEYVFMHFL